MRFFYRTLGNANKLINRIETKMQLTTVWSGPVVVDVVLTKACNFACSFCRDYETPTGAKRISLDNFERLAKQVFPRASRLDICSGGEPYLHTGLPDILRIAKRYDLYTWVLSNGSLIKPSVAEQIISEDLISEHGFSVDGFNAETVESIRLNAKLPTILKNIKMVQRLRDEQKKTNPRFTIRYALMRSNIEELADAVKLWGDMGIDRLECGYLSLTEHMDKGLSLYYHQDLMARCMDKARAAAEMYPELTLELPPLVEEEHLRTQPQKCEFPWRFIMVDTNGEILPCYRAFEAMRLPSVYGENSTRVKDIFNSEPYKQLRRTANDDSVEKYYAYCEQCEMRHGWAREASHLGDETWLDTLRHNGNLIDIEVNHQRPLKGTAYKINKKESDSHRGCA